ncbi:MAG: L-serine ammonia-lyase [Coxiella sp. RIFCSPHIGHO2_12_FULL_42_15]|nr:MAG: L-serine ammonia-lyase [Coxiella sp. RIFCSPHIGHO2_12_FULL_42_15]
MISVFELFSIGIGPSSSHTVGPMRAANEFVVKLGHRLSQVATMNTTLYGSLAFTGHGHGTDKAIVMGFCGELPESIDPDHVDRKIMAINAEKVLKVLGHHAIAYDLSQHLIFNYQDAYEFHPNAMKFVAYDHLGTVIAETIYFSIGGGFIVNEADIKSRAAPAPSAVPYPFNSAAELLLLCRTHRLSISDIMLANESVTQTQQRVYEKLLHIADVMQNCIDHGCRTEGILPGKLRVKRRAAAMYRKMIVEGKPSPLHPQAMNWLNVFALAVNEENAAGARVVTAPTNGAAGIIPAVLSYYRHFYPDANDEGIVRFLLTAGAIGILYKSNASISGAEMGCQGEVGVACSMAAAGLTAALHGTPEQIENAAEIGMEHNLGLTCDPVGGLVQIPCIERNAMGAVKAVNSTQLALAGDGSHKISLDMAISTMREIGHNMNSIYKETSQGGLALAVNLADC